MVVVGMVVWLDLDKQARQWEQTESSKRTVYGNNANLPIDINSTYSFMMMVETQKQTR